MLACSDFIEIRESQFTAKSLRMLFQDILPETNLEKIKFVIIFSYVYVIHLLSMVFKTVHRLILRDTYY